MTQIMLTDEQAQLLLAARGQVQFCDPQGNVLANVSRGFSDEAIAEAERRMTTEERWYTTEEVLQHLKALEQG